MWWGVQEMMREVGLEGYTAQEAHAELQQLLCKSEAQEATSRRKFRRARRRHVRSPHMRVPVLGV